ncbi:MAG: hypothetical protein H6739_03740 [Alphaproteobacteria bacterium]|nr:hypothetical protein [Alphaproteobacteria bacterium]
MISEGKRANRGRWLLWLSLAAALPATAGIFKKDPPPPPAAATPVVKEAVEPEAPDAPPAPRAPPMFPDGVPVAVSELPAGLASLSAQGCNACHYTQHDAWQGSAHRSAWISPTFRHAAEAAGDAPVCVSCHLPLATQQQQLVVEYTGGPLTTAKVKPNPSWDATLAQEGVTCAACHVRDGAVIGRRAAPGAPHPVKVSDELGTSAFCATCHQLTWPGADKPFYDTWGEWSASAYAEAGVRCQDCHMPPESGRVTASRSLTHAGHGFDAAHGRGLSVLVRVAPDAATRGEPMEATLLLQNTGAGHAIPTGSPFTRLRVEVALLDAEGEALGEPFVHLIGREVKPDPPYDTVSDTRLMPGDELALPVTLDLPQKGDGGWGVLSVRLLRQGPGGPEDTPFYVQKIPLMVY